MSGIQCALPGTLIAPAASSGITFFAGATGAAATNTATASVTMPAGIQANDFAIYSLWKPSTNTSGGLVSAAPTGFTNLTIRSGSGVSSYIWYKKLTGSESGAFTASWSIGQPWVASIVVFRGVNTTTPFAGTAGQSSPPTGTTLTYPTMTTTAANAAVVRLALARPSNTATNAGTFTPPASPTHTELQDFGSAMTGTYASMMTVCWYLQSAAGATGTADTTVSVSAVGHVHTLALNPA